MTIVNIQFFELLPYLAVVTLWLDHLSTRQLVHFYGVAIEANPALRPFLKLWNGNGIFIVTLAGSVFIILLSSALFSFVMLALNLVGIISHIDHWRSTIKDGVTEHKKNFKARD